MSEDDDSTMDVEAVAVGEDDEPLLLDTIWEDDKITRNMKKDTWCCGWCKKEFKGINATKALAHVLRLSGKSISGCKSFRKIDSMHCMTYEELRKRQHKRGSYAAKAKDVVVERMDEQGRQSSQMLIMSSGKKPATKRSAVDCSLSSEEPEGKQAKYLQTVLGNKVDKTAEKTMTMAIADMIHACGLPFSLASNWRF